LMRTSDESIQVGADLVPCIDSSVQHQASCEDKFVQVEPGIVDLTDTATSMTPVPVDIAKEENEVDDITELSEPVLVSAPRCNKELGRPVDTCDTYCTLAGFNIFDKMGHSAHCYYRCANCKAFLCHACKLNITINSLGPPCCKNYYLDGNRYSSSLTPNT